MQFDGDQRLVYRGAGTQAYGIALWGERDLSAWNGSIAHPYIRSDATAVCCLPSIWHNLKYQVNRRAQLHIALGITQRQGTNLRCSSNATGQDEKVAKFHNKFFIAQVF